MRITPASPPGPMHGVGLHHGVVLLMHPALGADVGAGEELLQIGEVVAVLVERGEHFFGRIVQGLELSKCRPGGDRAGHRR